MTAELLEAIPEQIAQLQIIPVTGGRFEVEVGGQRIFDRKREGKRFPEPGEILRLVQDLL